MTESTSSNIMTNEQYEQCKNIIWKQALKYSTWGVPVEELVAQGNLVFCECVLKWDETRAAFNTMLWLHLDWKLQCYIKTWQLWSAVVKLKRKETIRVKAKKKRSTRTMHNMKVVTNEVLYLTNSLDDTLTEDGDMTISDVVGKPAPMYEAARFHEWRRQLSRPAQEVISLVTGFPAETIEATGASSATTIRNAVFRHLSKDKGWHYNMIRQTFTEVQNALKEI